MKNFAKLFSILLVVCFGAFSFVACSNNENKQSTQIITTQNINDVGEKTEEDVADEVSKIDETEDANTFPITPGIYKFSKNTLTFNDIYYKNEIELLEFFETRDLNGVYDFVYKNGFDNFSKSLTTYNGNNSTYTKVINIYKNKFNANKLHYAVYMETAKDVFTNFGISITYTIENGIIVLQDNNPEFIINEETNEVSLLYPFYYIDNSTQATIYTPLYIKADLTIYHEIDITQDESFTGAYTYSTNSAQIKSPDGFVNETEAMKVLEEMFAPVPVNISLIDSLPDVELYFNKNNELYIYYADSTFIITEKATDSNLYTLFETLKINIVNEYYDITSNTKILTITIDIDGNTYFECKFEA